MLLERVFLLRLRVSRYVRLLMARDMVLVRLRDDTFWDVTCPCVQVMPTHWQKCVVLFHDGSTPDGFDTSAPNACSASRSVLPVASRMTIISISSVSRGTRAMPHHSSVAHLHLHYIIFLLVQLWWKWLREVVRS